MENITERDSLYRHLEARCRHLEEKRTRDFPRFLFVPKKNKSIFNDLMKEGKKGMFRKAVDTLNEQKIIYAVC